MKTVPLILPENPSGFRSIPSTEQRLESVERKIDQVVAKLDMILDSMTKPTQYIGSPTPVEGEFTFSVPKANIAPGIMDGLNKAKEPLFKQPAQSVEEEPRRTKGKTAIEQIEKRIKEDWGGLKNFRVKASHGLIVASVSVNKPRDGNYYTHILRITDTICNDPTKRKFQPALFGMSEVEQTVEYLKSLGVNVNTSALDNK